MPVAFQLQSYTSITRWLLRVPSQFSFSLPISNIIILGIWNERRIWYELFFLVENERMNLRKMILWRNEQTSQNRFRINFFLSLFFIFSPSHHSLHALLTLLTPSYSGAKWWWNKCFLRSCIWNESSSSPNIFRTEGWGTSGSSKQEERKMRGNSGWDNRCVWKELMRENHSFLTLTQVFGISWTESSYSLFPSLVSCLFKLQDTHTSGQMDRGRRRGAQAMHDVQTKGK